MSRTYILHDGEPVKTDDLYIWAYWFEHADDERRVAEDLIGDVRVSTVFLGIDHSFLNEPPLLYETMIFGGVHNDYQDRYTTRQEAEDGHRQAVALVRGSSAS